MRTYVQINKTGISYQRKNRTSSNDFSLKSLGIDILSTNVNRAKYYWICWFLLVSIYALICWRYNISFFIVPTYFLSLALMLYLSYKQVLKVTYSLDPDSASNWESFLNATLELCSQTTLWAVLDSTQNSNSKYHGGSWTTISRSELAAKRVKLKRNPEYPLEIRINVPTLVIRSSSCAFWFLPDGLLVQIGNNVTTYAYPKTSLTASTTRFIDYYPVAHDAEIVDITWQYVNRNGSPDARFKDNYQLPVCLYGKLTAVSGNSSITFLTSGKNVTDRFLPIYEKYKSYISQLVWRS